MVLCKFFLEGCNDGNGLLTCYYPNGKRLPWFYGISFCIDERQLTAADSSGITPLPFNHDGNEPIAYAKMTKGRQANKGVLFLLHSIMLITC